MAKLADRVRPEDRPLLASLCAVTARDADRELTELGARATPEGRAILKRAAQAFLEPQTSPCCTGCGATPPAFLSVAVGQFCGACASELGARRDVVEYLDAMARIEART